MAKRFKKCSLQNLPTNRSALVSMRRTAELVVPGTVLAVTDSRCLLTPSPQLNKCMNPHIQVERSNIGKIVPNLLLTCTFNLFEVMKVLLDSHSIRNRLQYLLGGCRKVCAHISSPGIYCFANHQDQNQTASRTICGLKEFNFSGFKLAIKRYLNLKPSSFFSGLMAKVNSFAILTRSSTLRFLPV